MRPRHLAIFDFDGTIADSLSWFVTALNEAARVHGFREVMPAEREALRNQTSRQILAFLGLPPWKLPLVARTLRSLAARDIDQIKLYPWVPDRFRELAERGVLIAVVSSNAEANIRKVLGIEAGASVAHIAAGASLFGKTAKFRTVMRKCSPLGGRIAAIGDEVRDVEAAHKAGIASLAVTWGAATREALREARPSRLISDPRELSEWFGS